MKKSVCWIVYLFSFTLIFTHCKSKKEKTNVDVVREFDSLNRELDKMNNSYEEIDTLSNAIAAKYSQSFLQQFTFVLTDCKKYLSDLKFRFVQFCGDTAGESIPMKNFNNTELARDFFSKENGETLYNKLKQAQKTLTSHNDDPVLDEKINTMTGSEKGNDVKTFVQTYFSNIPPVAAMTIISKFENDIRYFEIEVLKNLLKDPHVTAQ
jgi:hypothetical protein